MAVALSDLDAAGVRSGDGEQMNWREKYAKRLGGRVVHPPGEKENEAHIQMDPAGKCDLAVPSHLLEGEEHIIGAAEMRDYADAYAHMAYDQIYDKAISLGRLEKEDFLNRARALVRGDLLVFPDLEFSMELNEWASCDHHYKMWQAYKRKYPKEVLQ